jgi:ferrochelatase
MDKVLSAVMDEQPDEITLIPLFPQYASATTGSVIEEMSRVLRQRYNIPSLRVVSDFYDEPRFIAAFAAVARPQIEAFRPDHVLFSYHGLPESQIRKADPTQNHCLKGGACCERIEHSNRYCYRAQCFGTTRALVAALKLEPSVHSTSFQSRLGRAAWIQPYTEERLGELRKQGVKRLAVMCPAFVADCLETIEEIGMRAAEDWKSMGGEEFKMITSLNSEDVWCDAIAAWVRQTP